LNHVCNEIIPRYTDSTIELVVVHPFKEQRFEWTDIPACIKKHAEMRFHGVGAGDEVFETYGVDAANGAAVVVRPDGYVGLVTSLKEIQKVGLYFDGCLVRKSSEK
jgi:phenol 2-monooxygenase